MVLALALLGPGLEMVTEGTALNQLRDLID
jgi:hypothetical protein